MTKFVMNKKVIMKNILKKARSDKELKSRELATMLGVDQAMVSKYENGKRLPTEEQMRKIISILDLPEEQTMVFWLKEKILLEVYNKPYAKEALQLVSEALPEYLKIPIHREKKLLKLLERIDSLKKELSEIRANNNSKITEALEIEYTYESNRIEGNTLTLNETNLVINHGLTISGKSMREHLEAVNHKEAIDYIHSVVDKSMIFNEREILNIHNLILRGIDPQNAGKYREVQVMISGSSHVPPNAFQLKELMEEYFNWYLLNRKNLHPVILAAEMHERLVTIHPFIDGNGRTSRLVMNAILLQHGYMIANIKGDNTVKLKYYEALEKVRTNNSKDSFIQFIAEVELECLERYLKIAG